MCNTGEIYPTHILHVRHVCYKINLDSTVKTISNIYLAIMTKLQYMQIFTYLACVEMQVLYMRNRYMCNIHILLM